MLPERVLLRHRPQSRGIAVAMAIYRRDAGRHAAKDVDCPGEKMVRCPDETEVSSRPSFQETSLVFLGPPGAYAFQTCQSRSTNWENFLTASASQPLGRFARSFRIALAALFVPR